MPTSTRDTSSIHEDITVTEKASLETKKPEAEEKRLPPEIFRGHEFEALKCRFEDQTELLHRMTLIDLQVFSGYITLQLALGAWLATHKPEWSSPVAKYGVMVIDLVLAAIAIGLLNNSGKRRDEVIKTVANCNNALGYETEGVYLENKTLNEHTRPRLWKNLYFLGIIAALVGIVLVLFGDRLSALLQ